MKIVVYESDAKACAKLDRLLKQILGEQTEILHNMPVLRLFGAGEDFDNALFIVDTSYKVADSNFLLLARHIREYSDTCHIVFTSSCPSDIVFCCKELVRPSGFFLKPIKETELRQFLMELERFELARKTVPEDVKILLRTRGELTIVCASEVLFFTASDKKVICYTDKGDKHMFYGSLGTLEKDYRDSFLRCHSGFLVNRYRIERFNKTTMTLHIRGTNETVPVSKSRMRTVESYVENCLNRTDVLKGRIENNG